MVAVMGGTVMMARSDGCGGDGGRIGKVPDQDIKGRPLRVAVVTQGDVSLCFVLLENVTCLCECDGMSGHCLGNKTDSIGAWFSSCYW